MSSGCNNYNYGYNRCNGQYCPNDASVCQSGFCSFYECKTLPIPVWAVVAIVFGVTLVIIILGLVYKRCRINKLKRQEAEFLARN